MRGSAAISTMIFLSVSAPIRAQPQADGLYRISDEDTGRSVLSDDGRRYWLGDTVEVPLDERSIVSTDNRNEMFQLRLRYTSDEIPPVTIQALADGTIVFPRFVLLIDNVPSFSNGVGGGSGQTSANFRLSGAERAERVAEYFDTDVLYRFHPGHRLMVRFAPMEQTVKAGSAVPIVFEITNVGNVAVGFGNGGLPLQFAATRSRMSRESVPITGGWFRMGGTTGSHEVQPGETERIEANVAEWLTFDEAGEYEVLGYYNVHFRERDRPAYEAIWSEQLSGRFRVTVEP